MAKLIKSHPKCCLAPFRPWFVAFNTGAPPMTIWQRAKTVGLLYIIERELNKVDIFCSDFTAQLTGPLFMPQFDKLHK